MNSSVMGKIKFLHKWLSLLVGIQLLLWIGTGLYFNLMDSQKARGTQYLAKSTAMIADDTVKPAHIEPAILLNSFKPAVSLSQVSLLDKPYYLLTHDKALYPYFKNHYTLIDAITGKQVMIDQAMAMALAVNSYNGPGIITSISRVSPPFDDRLKEKNTLWRVNFDDEINTSVYIDEGSGRLIGHSNDDKRIVDIAFMLHFMDYANEGSFNNVQIIVFAIFTLFFAFTGFIWTIELGLNGQYSLTQLLPKRLIRKTDNTIQVIDIDGQQLRHISIPAHENLLDGLIHQNIALPSSCGGGGSCGRCRVKLKPEAKVTACDNQQFTQDELALGYRLACQHTSDEVDSLSLLDITQAEKHQLELISSEFISPFIKELRFKTVSSKPITFKAGAFMRFFIPAASSHSLPVALPESLSAHWKEIDSHQFTHDSCSRNYSLANSYHALPDAENELHFTIKLQQAPKFAASQLINPGVGSHYICNLQPGDRVEAAGPFEEFSAQPISERSMVMIGAGSGIAPLKSLIEEQLVKFKSTRPIHFFFGARSEADLIYQEKFTELAVEHKHFFYYPVLSRPTHLLNGNQPTSSSITSHDGAAQSRVNSAPTQGYVQDRLAAQLDEISKQAGGLANIEFYLCGPESMMTSTIEQLKARGVKESAIAFDSFV
ncbi:2Fe-2S iron-sulfur cluster-binding protein [Shewanella woodyi]|uniref:2Fe-2S iron-sulfur cluster-binding protein n=1 Tax=Shewanella woodyi TaxID=60961 RepID=UPI0037493480